MSEEKIIDIKERKPGEVFLVRKHTNAEPSNLWFKAEVIEINKSGQIIIGYFDTSIDNRDIRCYGCNYVTIIPFLTKPSEEIKAKFISFHQYGDTLKIDTKDIISKKELKGEQTMAPVSDKDKQASLVDMLKGDAHSAMYRATASQITKGTKATILKLMEQQGQDSLKVKAISDLMETKAGDALVSVMIGMLLHYLPKISEDARAQKLSTEFRINGMSIGIEAAMELVVGNFLPMFQEAIASLPQEEKIRVSTPAEMMAPKEDIANIATTLKTVNG